MTPTPQLPLAKGGLFSSSPAILSPEVALARAQLALTLATLDIGSPRTVQELRELCASLGLWPVPSYQAACLHALAWVGPQLLTLFADCPQERRSHFERWQHAVTRGDSVSAAHWLCRLGLWPALSDST